VNNTFDADPKTRARPKAKIKLTVQSSEHTRMAKKTAYCRAQQRGVLPGYALLDWLETEAEINEQHGKSR
jgi:hypothetical protein